MKQEIQSSLDDPASFDPNPDATKTFISPSFASPSDEPFPEALVTQDAQAPASQYIFVCTGHWQGIVSGRRVIAYVGEVGSDASGDNPDSGTGEMWLQLFNNVNEVTDSKTVHFEGTGSLRYASVDGDIATVVPQTGQPFQVDLSQQVASMQ